MSPRIRHGAGLTVSTDIAASTLVRLADQLLARIAEQGFGGEVDEQDAATLVDDHQAVGRMLDDSPELLLGPTALRRLRPNAVPDVVRFLLASQDPAPFTGNVFSS